MIEFALVAFAAALVVAAALVPIARRVALAAGLVAAVRPGRLHTEPRACGGGLAIADTLILVVGGGWLLMAATARAGASRRPDPDARATGRRGARLFYHRPAR